MRGNHDDKLYRVLASKKKTVPADMQATIEAIANMGNEFKQQVTEFMAALPYQVIFRNGAIITAHAGLEEKYQGKDGRGMQSFALYGGPTGQFDESGYPVLKDWVKDYQGQAYVVYGHTPVSQPEWINKTINIDTGCYLTGVLTALKWPEMEIVQVGGQDGSTLWEEN